MSARYFECDNMLLRRQSPDHWPEVYRGNGTWDVYKNMFKFDHEAETLTDEEARAMMARRDK